MRAIFDRQDYLSKRNSDCLKGIFAVCVLIHHLYQHSGLFRNSPIGAALQFLGYFSVGVFFFLSGFGLMQSYRRKGKEYLRTFPKKRLLPYYLMMVLLIVIYSAYTLIMGDQLPLAEVIQSLLFGGTVIGNGWYLQVQLLCYILFYAAFCLSKKESAGLYITTALTIGYVAVMLLIDRSMSWYVSTPLFAVGLWFSCCKDKFDAFLYGKGKWLLTFLVSGVLCLAMLLGYKILNVKHLKPICLNLSECAFVLCVLLILVKVRIDYKLTRMLGSISLEIYVMQGLCLKLFHSKFANIQNPYIYVAAVVLSTVVLAIVIHPLIKSIYSLCGGSRGESR